MKVVTNCEALGVEHFPRKLAIVDSPGIIGSPVSTNDEAQQYFKRLTRHFADLADVVLLFFDPDKPGTTKEANDVFRECLAHINSVKLHIIFNKVDAFKSLEDFGKAHGTLYWNLSAAMMKKDVPIVHNMFCPTEDPIDRLDRRSSLGGTASPLKKGTHAHALRTLLTDEFEQTRKLIERKVRDAPKRATENTIHEFSDTLLRMHMHGCMLTACGNIYRRQEIFWRGIFWASLAGTAAVVARVGWTAALRSYLDYPASSHTPSSITNPTTTLSRRQSVTDHFLTQVPWVQAFRAVWKVGVVGIAISGSLWGLGSAMLSRTVSAVFDQIDDIWTEFGFSIRDGVLHRRKSARSPNLVRSKWPTDADEEVLALWKRTKPQLIGTLKNHYSSLSDIPVLSKEDETLIKDMLQDDGAKLNDLARS